METATAPTGRQCEACGAELNDDVQAWCASCGASLLPDGVDWDVTLSPDEPSEAPGESDPSGAEAFTAASPHPWAARLRSRRAVAVLAVAMVVVLAAAAVAGLLATRGSGVQTEALFPVSLTNAYGIHKLGYIDRQGEMVILLGAFSEPSGSMFSEGLARVSFGDKTGFIDTIGRPAIQPQFAEAGDFREGRAVVRIDNSAAYIDRTGTYIVAPGGYSDGHDFSEGLAVVGEVIDGDTCYGYIGVDGTLAIPATFVAAGDFSEGLAPAAVIDHGAEVWGYIDKTGKWVVQPQLFAADSFSEGLAAVAVITSDAESGRWGYIDKSGSWRISPRFASAGRFAEDVACVVDTSGAGSGLAGFIDRSGAWTIQPRFAEASGFAQGLAAARDAGGAGEWGYVAHNGEWVVAPGFTTADPFVAQGLALVTLPATTTLASAAASSASGGTEALGTGKTGPGGTRYSGSSVRRRIPDPVSAYIDKTGSVVWSTAMAMRASRTTNGSMTAAGSSTGTDYFWYVSPNP